MRLLVLAVIALLAAGGASAEVTLTHVHGLSYSGDGKKMMIPSHYGLAVYEGGNPAPGSGLVNPFGLIRSKDGGKTWEKLGLEGETDFHLLATGWNTNTIYVWNPASSSRMKRAGLHYTLNEGFAWKPAGGKGLEGDPHALGLHPDDAGNVAVATSEGIFE